MERKFESQLTNQNLKKCIHLVLCLEGVRFASSSGIEMSREESI